MQLKKKYKKKTSKLNYVPLEKQSIYLPTDSVGLSVDGETCIEQWKIKIRNQSVSQFYADRKW